MVGGPGISQIPLSFWRGNLVCLYGPIGHGLSESRGLFGLDGGPRNCFEWLAMLWRFLGSVYEQRSSTGLRDFHRRHPVGRLGTVEEAVQVVVALLENPFITGSILAVDGGWTAQ
jgi:hypothetical protein